MLHSSARAQKFLQPQEILDHVRFAGTLRPAEAALGARAIDALLAVPAALAELFPEGGLRRGSTVTVSGSSLVLALVAEAIRAKGWGAEVGSPLLGSAAAAEAGVPLERFVRVPEPGEQWPSVVASMVEAFDVVVVHPPTRAREADLRRLTARARERGAVLLVTASWPDAMINLSVTGQHWHGLGSGHGYLRTREVDVQAVGRGAAARPRRVRVWLPGADAVIASARESAA